MKKLLIIFVAAIILPMTAEAKQKKEDNGYDLKVMSYNMRMGTANDGTNSWKWRYPATALMLDDQEPDIFGVQEAFDFQIEFILENLRHYKSVGVGRDDGKSKGEHMSIFWNKKRIQMLKWGTFWLSETPEKPSKGWDAGCMRTATWALMKDKRTGNKFYFINTHLDHIGKEAQTKGLMLIIEKIGEINSDKLPVVLTGDFNIKPHHPALKELDVMMQSTRKVADSTDNHQTFNGWGKAKRDMVIDYIYISGFSKCTEYKTVTKKYAERTYVSDHYPIYSTLIF